MAGGIAERYAETRAAVAEACHAAGRDPSTVRIVAVTKYVGFHEAKGAYDAGCRDLGESRPQELWRKAEAFAEAGLQPRWHLIGHLQRNKVRRTLAVRPLLIHSLDSARLLEAVDAEARGIGAVVDALVEVNLDGGQDRTGVPIAEVRPLVEATRGCGGVRLVGLMGMASVPEHDGATDAGRAQARGQFATLRKLLESLREEGLADESMTELSMGMSGDWREAIHEGATLVRIGSALFR